MILFQILLSYPLLIYSLLSLSSLMDSMIYQFVVILPRTSSKRSKGARLSEHNVNIRILSSISLGLYHFKNVIIYPAQGIPSSHVLNAEEMQCNAAR
ncbi:hypothetical protein BKA64DRAFT_433199 [Cadophora sp. MPI-SDFR-AT-0126]|nr:hypothetical protein BKA64DRAFT_433199 [Leotiomycetes sp. MPI-SDFR-AT-0126]